jgi:hypothetical protein
MVGAKTAQLAVDRIQNLLLGSAGPNYVTSTQDQLISTTAQPADHVTDQFVSLPVANVISGTDGVDPGIQSGEQQGRVIESRTTESDLRDPQSRVAERAVPHLDISITLSLPFTG